MLDSILEFITQAASNSTFIFCFCNLIIVFIFVDLKPSLKVHQESDQVPLSMGTNSKFLVQKGANLQQVIQASHVEEAESEAEVEAEAEPIEVDLIETIGNDDCCNEEVEKEEEGEDDDDELRRRVEEFIEKVNKGWKEELLST